MQKATAKRHFRAVESIKNILLALLVFSMIALVVVYIRGTPVYESVSGRADSELTNFDRLWSVEGGAKAEGLDQSRLIPEFIGYRKAGSVMSCAIADRDSTELMYSLIKPCIIELFGQDSVCRELTASEGREKIESAAASDEYIFMRYHVPVLFHLIYAYASDQLTIDENDVAHSPDGSISAYISEIVIVPDYTSAGHRYIAYAYDGSDGYFEFRPEDHVVTSNFYITRLAESAGGIASYSFDFADDPRLGATQPIISKEVEYNVIETVETDFTSEEILLPLLRLFGYNPDKLSGYVDDTGVNVFVDSNSHLRVDNSQISFVTSDAAAGKQRGIRLDSLLGYSSGDTLNLFDKLTAVDNLIRQLGEISPALTGGEAALCLGSVYSSETQLIIEYVLTYNNILVGGDCVLRAVLTQDAISRIELSPVYISEAGESAYCVDQNYTLRKLTELGLISESRKLGGMRLQYDGEKATWHVLAD